MDTLSLIGKLAKLAITSYLACLAREERVEQICFLLTQYTVESCSIPKNLGNFAKLLTDIQKIWLKFCLKKLESLKDRSVYKIVDLCKKWKVIKNNWVFNIKFDSCFRS